MRRKRPPLLTKQQRQKRLQFAKGHKNLTEKDWENFFVSDEEPFFLFIRPYLQNDVVWDSQESQVPKAPQVKNCANAMVWGGMSVKALTRLHFVPAGKTVTANYYVNTILEKNLKHCLNRRRTTGSVTENKMVENVGSVILQQDGTAAHTSKLAQEWCSDNLPNFIRKDEWPGNSADLNPIENLRPILKVEVYKGQEPTTMKPLRRKLQNAWSNLSQETLESLVHSMPKRIKAVLNERGGQSGY